MESLRSYVLGGDGDKETKAITTIEGHYKFEITHSVLSDNESIGTEPKYMELLLRTSNREKIIERFTSDERTLESYSNEIRDGMNIHVIDRDPNHYIADLQDTSSIDKVEYITDDQYDQKEGTAKKWFQQQQQEAMVKKLDQQLDEQQRDEQLIKSFTIGQRCKVFSTTTTDNVDDDDYRLGTIEYIGKTEFAPGYWIGVKLDLPLGKNNGTVKGKLYFTCPQNYGSFVKPKNILVGDFPEEEI
eukprot:gene1359-1716_t